MNCTHCGAPIEANDEVCQYCGKMTAYGEKMIEQRKLEEKEEQRRQAIENLPAIKYVSLSFTVIMYMITFGAYSVWWYAMRIAPLKALNTNAKFPVWPVLLMFLGWCGLAFIPNNKAAFGLSEDVWGEVYNVALGVLFVASIYAAFAVRSILQEYAAGFMPKAQAVQTIAPSGMLTIIFGPLYLQSAVNKMIAMKMLAPKI